jgi:hypothetical protein
MRSTFRHLFYINRDKVKKNGLCPVMGRITVDGDVAQFSTGQETSPKFWDAKTGRSAGKTAHCANMNGKLDGIASTIERQYARMVETDGYVTA